MVLNDLKNKYKMGEPIFLDEIPASSRGYLRQQVKRFIDNGLLTRVCNGVYYVPYKTILGTDGKMSIKKYIEKKYLNRDGQIIGYYTGLYMLNQYGFTTQNSACYEVCSNAATTRSRKIIVDKNEIIVYKPIIEINDNNVKYLRFLDLILFVDRYTELSVEATRDKIEVIMRKENITQECLNDYLSMYPMKIYKSLYKYCGGIADAVV